MFDGNNRPIILFATPPTLDQLCAITIRLSTSAQSVARFQPQVIKCREFIFTEPEVIGTPSPDINDHCFHLVAKVSFMKAGKLQTRVTRIGLQATKPYPVTTELYESCLRYTLLARLSPNWNKAGPWLVQGRDFLTHKGCANAVKMNVNVSNNELFFTLEAAVLKLAPLQVTDLDIVGKHLEVFLTNPAAQLDHESIASDWCFILPSMKRGRIFSISHDLPEDSPFRTYRDLKRHWKNTYGYRLPESEDDMNFYQIRFGPLGGKLFTYPEVCLRGRDLQKVARVDPKPILRAFMLEIQSKFPTVCGCPIKLQSKAKFPNTDLLASGQAAIQKQPNLTNKMSSSRPAVYRSKAEMEKMLTSSSEAPTRLPIGSEQASKDKITVPQINHSIKDISDKTAARINHNSTIRNVRPITNKQHMTSVSSNQVQQMGQTDTRPHPVNVQVNGSYICHTKGTDSSSVGGNNVSLEDAYTPSHRSLMNNQETVSNRLFPQFKPKKLQLTEPAKPPAQKIIPMFHPQKKLSSVVSGSQVKAKSTVNKPFISHTPSFISTQVQGHPTSTQGQGHPTSTQCQGHPTSTQCQGHPTSTQGQGHPTSTQGQGHPTSTQGQGHPTSTQGQGHPISTQGQGHPTSTQCQGHPISTQGQGHPTSTQGQGHPTSTQGQGHPTSTQGQGLVPSFQRSAVTTYSHKDIPIFSKGNVDKTMPSFQKSGTPKISSILTKKGNARTGQGGKEQKDKKATKRQKGVKTQGETKKAKKLKKAEA